MWEAAEGDVRRRRAARKRREQQARKTYHRNASRRNRGKHANPILRILAAIGLWPDPIFG